MTQAPSSSPCQLSPAQKMPNRKPQTSQADVLHRQSRRRRLLSTLISIPGGPITPLWPKPWPTPANQPVPGPPACWEQAKRICKQGRGHEATERAENLPAPHPAGTSSSQELQDQGLPLVYVRIKQGGKSLHKCSASVPEAHSCCLGISPGTSSRSMQTWSKTEPLPCARSFCAAPSNCFSQPAAFPPAHRRFSLCPPIFLIFFSSISPLLQQQGCFQMTDWAAQVEEINLRCVP